MIAVNARYSHSVEQSESERLLKRGEHDELIQRQTIRLRGEGRRERSSIKLNAYAKMVHIARVSAMRIINGPLIYSEIYAAV